MARLNVDLEAAGAEFLVLGNLLIEKISAYKAYSNFPGYDLVATNPETNKSTRIQVKSRYHSNPDGFIIKNLVDCDFVVLVHLNRGYQRTRRNGDNGIKKPTFFIFPIDYVKKISDPNNNWGKITKSKMLNHEDFEDRWDLIRKSLI